MDPDSKQGDEPKGPDVIEPDGPGTTPVGEGGGESTIRSDTTPDGVDQRTH